MKSVQVLVDELAIVQEHIDIKQHVEAEMSAMADARSNTPSWIRISQGDQLYIQELILELCSLAHGRSVAIRWN